jgi:anaerobic glycerol-3-phosphate dehydrogenase
MTYTDAIDRINQYRRERFLTITALAGEMRAAGCPVATRSLHLALKHQLRTQPRETTRWKLEQFAEALDAAATLARKATRKPARRRVA